MAKFVLGGIVTNIAGSVGGTTLRRVPNGFSMYNKIKGTSNSRLLQNARVPQIANIFQRWSLLSDSERAGWNATALTVTFPDKFGVAKNLTGRQLFTKANIQLLPDNNFVVDSTGFTTENIPYSQNDISSNLGANAIEAGYVVPSDTAQVMFSVEISNKQIYQPTFKSRKVIQVEGLTGSGNVNLYDAIFLNFPYIAVGMYLNVYSQSVNAFGMVSPYQVTSTMLE